MESNRGAIWLCNERRFPFSFSGSGLDTLVSRKHSLPDLSRLSAHYPRSAQ